jgi:hypothetical protein
MKSSTQNREATKVKEVANEYKKKGFRVIVEPSQSDLPEELKKLNFQPDIIASSGDTNLVIEIKSFESIKNKALVELAEKINAIEGWEFELVYTNPKTKYEIPAITNSSTYIEAKNSLERAAKFLDTDASKEYSDAALLLIWSAVENALRANYKTYKPNEETTTPRALVRDSVIMGIIGKNDQQFLESMMMYRNEISHGVFQKRILKKDLEKLIKLGISIVDQIA